MNKKDFRTVTRKDGTTWTYIVGETKKQVVKAFENYAREKGRRFECGRKRIYVTEDCTSCYSPWQRDFFCSLFCNLNTLEVR